MPAAFTLRPGRLTLAELKALAPAAPIRLDPGADAAIDRAVDTVRAVLREQRTVYGVNTGFGSLAKTRIQDAELAELQRRLVLSHAAGTGPLLGDAIVRLVLVLKANALALGHSGIRRKVIEALLTLHMPAHLPNTHKLSLATPAYSST